MRQPQSTRCALTGDLHPLSHMVRVVYHPAHGWGVDLKGDLPTQGWWIIPDAIMIHQQIKVLCDSAGSEVRPDFLVARVDEALIHQVQSLLSLARRASCTSIGGDRIRRLFGEGKQGYLLRALDGGSEKLWQWLQKAHNRDADCACLTQQELAEPFSREALGSVFIINLGFCLKLSKICAKLERIRCL